jgi:predicted transposase YbfD/YdcC
MAQSGMNRRLAGWLKARLAELGLEEVQDFRRRQGRRWKLPVLLQTALVGLMAGCQSLTQLEWLTEDMSIAIRRMLGIGRRVADTTLRDTLVQLCPTQLRARLHAAVRAAHRRRALAPVGLPFGVLAMDGKATALPAWDSRYASRTVHEESGRAFGLLRTITCALVSAAGKPCVDAIPLLDGDNEVGAFGRCFEAVLRAFSPLFHLVTYDAGATSEENAQSVVDAGKAYLLRLKDERRFMTKAAMGWLASLGAEAALASTTDVLSKSSEEYVVRRLFLCRVRRWGICTVWAHAQTFVRVQSQRVLKGRVTAEENRYYAASLEQDALTPAQWLSVVRHHWGVENNCHNTFDSIFREDDKPWIETSPRGALAVLLLRRIAYTLLTLFKHRTLRSEDNRLLPWRRLMKRLYNALVSATPEQLLGLRDRAAVAAS